VRVGGVDRESEDVTKCIIYLKIVIHRVIKIGTRLRYTGVKLSTILIMTQYSASAHRRSESRGVETNLCC